MHRNVDCPTRQNTYENMNPELLMFTCRAMYNKFFSHLYFLSFHLYTYITSNVKV